MNNLTIKNNRLRCGVALLDSDDNILLIYERSFTEDMRRWGFPKGGVEESDVNNRATAFRELKEETGIVINKNSYNEIGIRNNSNCIIFVVKLTYSHTDVKIDLQKSEIIEHKWVKYTELVKDVISNPKIYNISVKIMPITIEEIRGPTIAALLDKLNVDKELEKVDSTQPFKVNFNGPLKIVREDTTDDIVFVTGNITVSMALSKKLLIHKSRKIEIGTDGDDSIFNINMTGSFTID